MSSLLAKLAQWQPFTAIVVGDFMLDQLVYGDAERLTADAPVPVLQVRRTEQAPGGAANVCMDLVAMHARVIAFGVTGTDPEAAILRDALAAGGVDTRGLIADAYRPTTVKRSLIGLAQHRHPQKMFRVDHESRLPLASDVIDRMLAQLRAALPQADVVLIEDYAKGVCGEDVCRLVIDLARSHGLEVLVDPALLSDYSRYRGCTAITPNRTEAERATGMETDDHADAAHNARLARALLRTVDAQAVVLTLDKHGALLLERSGEPVVVPTRARQVYDVTGAGDMVLAALAAARANGIDWEDAVRFANAAAGLEVEVFGVQPIPFEKIYRSVLLEGRQLVGKQRTLEEAVVEVAAARREGRKVVFTNGCFDVIHAGHIALLRRSAEQGDLLVVGLNSDDSVRRLKGPERPVHALADRIAVLSELESVDLIVPFESDTPIELIRALRPDVLCKGADYSREHVVGGDFVESYGGSVVLIEFLQGRSTTETIRRIRSR